MAPGIRRATVPSRETPTLAASGTITLNPSVRPHSQLLVPVTNGQCGRSLDTPRPQPVEEHRRPQGMHGQDALGRARTASRPSTSIHGGQRIQARMPARPRPAPCRRRELDAYRGQHLHTGQSQTAIPRSARSNRRQARCLPLRRSGERSLRSPEAHSATRPALRPRGWPPRPYRAPADPA